MFMELKRREISTIYVLSYFIFMIYFCRYHYFNNDPLLVILLLFILSMKICNLWGFTTVSEGFFSNIVRYYGGSHMEKDVWNRSNLIIQMKITIVLLTVFYQIV